MPSDRNSIIDAAKREYAERQEELLSVEVPEWRDENGDAISVFYRRGMSVAEMEKTFEGCDMRDGNLTTDMLFNAFFVVARDKDGRKLFVGNDRKEARNRLSSDVVLRVVGEMTEIWEGADGKKK